MIRESVNSCQNNVLNKPVKKEQIVRRCKMININVSMILIVLSLFFCVNRINAQTIFDTIDVPALNIGFDPTGIAVNSKTNTIYLSNFNDKSLIVVNGETNEIVVTIKVGERPHGVDVNEQTNTVYVANYLSDSVSVIDGSNNQIITTIPVGQNPWGVGVNETTNRVYVANEFDFTVSVIDGVNNQVIDTITVSQLPTGVSVNQITNKIYVTSRNENNVTVIDGTSDEVTDTINVGSGPYGIGVNEITNMIYVANENSDELSVIDGNTNKTLFSLPVSKSPIGIGINPTTNHIYVSSEKNVDVEVIDGETNQIVGSVSLGSSLGVAANPETNFVYITSHVFLGVVVVQDGEGGGVIGGQDELKAEFSAEPTVGTVPLEVQFNDASTGEPTGWFWEFGDGATSSQQNPVHIYTDAGLYTVSLLASLSGDKDTIVKSDFIDVRELSELKADFTADPVTGFVPLEVQFRDLSTGEPTSWVWSFGDGGQSEEQDAFHEYLVSGIFTVDLIVTRSGISSTERKINFVSVIENSPVAEFKASATVGQAPIDISFADLSQPVGDISTWLWSFGDGSTSTEQHTSHTYNIEGFYTIELIVSNEAGSDTEKKTNMVIVKGQNAPVSEFQASVTTGLAPLEVQFFDLSEPFGNVNSFLWDFGDGVIRDDQNPSHIYNQEGIFTVSLTVSNSFGADTEVKPNIVSIIGTADDVLAAFTTSSTIGIAPASIEFLNNSAGDIQGSKWDFGDETSSIEVSPNHIYREPGEYSVALSVEGRASIDTVKNDNLLKIISEDDVAAAFRATPLIGNTPVEIQFVDKSLGNVGGWLWDFGDGSTSTDQNPKHTYFQPGKYAVTLAVSGQSGASDSRKKDDFIEILEDDDSTDDPDDTPTPEQTPAPDDNKSFTFKCRQHTLIAGKKGVFEKMILNLGENEQCTVTLTNLEPEVSVEFSTFLRSGRSTSIQVSPENGVTDSNGQMEFTISAIEKGTDWIAWAVRNENGEFEFSKSAYDDGTAWGMFVEVK